MNTIIKHALKSQQVSMKAVIINLWSTVCLEHWLLISQYDISIYFLKYIFTSPSLLTRVLNKYSLNKCWMRVEKITQGSWDSFMNFTVLFHWSLWKILSKRQYKWHWIQMNEVWHSIEKQSNKSQDSIICDFSMTSLGWL